jgi:hypothetical protein
MKGNLEDLMNSASGDLNEQTLMDYLQGRLNAEQAHMVEKKMVESGFLNDAVEGLTDMKDKQRIAAILQELNGKLQTKTEKKKERFSPLIPDQQTLTIVSLITILLLIILSFVIYKMSRS